MTNGEREIETELLSNTDADAASEEMMMMTPWEQHSAVISIPRFDYNAPSSLLQHSHSGFLITCPCSSIFTTEEKSATKRRKLDTNDGSVSPVKVDTDGETGPLLKLVKVTKSGLLLFIFNKNISPNVVGIVSKMVQSVESGSSGSLLWCNRIFPIQATCSLNEKELREVVSKLVNQFMKDNQKLVWPIKFAIAYNRRGIETELDIPKEAPNAFDLLDRNKCFAVVASAVKDVVSDSVVDLKSPVLSVLIELLPLSGVPKWSLVVAVSVLHRNVVSAKPKLSIKALVSDTKPKGGKP